MKIFNLEKIKNQERILNDQSIRLINRENELRQLKEEKEALAVDLT